jgi:hypothetical protein
MKFLSIIKVRHILLAIREILKGSLAYCPYFIEEYRHILSTCPCVVT